MTFPHRTVAIIPARGGSQRIPLKNIRDFNGKPVICYPIATALASGLFDEVIVSTDDDRIAEVATLAGARVVKRATCDGTTGTQEVAARVLDFMPDVVYACVIYATSPLIAHEDLMRGWREINRFGTTFAMSVGDAPLQDAGCWYWGTAKAFRQRTPLIDVNTRMVPIGAHRVCDIDTEEDWNKAIELHNQMLNLRGHC